MRAVSAVLVISLLVGCAGSQATKTRRYAELGLGGSLAGVIAGSLAIAAAPGHKEIFIPITIAFGGLAVASTIVFAIAHGQAPVAPPPPPPPPDRRPEAWTYTQQAQGAARAGDCATVRALDVQVRELDASFHASVFARDVAIARCLAASEP